MGVVVTVHDVLVPLAVGLGAAAGAGLMLAVAGLRRTAARPSARRSVWGRWRALLKPRLFVALAAGLLVVAVTRWPVAGVLVVVGVVALPQLLGPDRRGARRIERMEAIATWTEMLRDTLSAAAGLGQALLATAPLAPGPVRNEVAALAERIRAGQPLPEALERFAVEMDDPAADTVVTVLRVASHRQAAQLGPLLGSLAEAVRDQVAMRQRVGAGRTSTRTSIRVCCGTTLTLAAGLMVFNQPYLEPFGTPLGQLALALAGGLFAASFAWLHSIARVAEPPRLLSRDTDGVPVMPAPRSAVSR
ncbi:type II secretion system F family protein [Streptomyces profundus]|nr:type II secretion system F family protein [Streptomyces sp. MA3_2.13]